MTHPPKKILVVDDDAGIQELLDLALTGEGYSVRVARDGLEALAAIEIERPDLVVLDLMMPRLDGYGLSKELQRRGLREGIPILVLTAATRGRERADELRAEAYVDKPFSLGDLLQAVSRLADTSPGAISQPA